MNLIKVPSESAGMRTWRKRILQYDKGIPIPESMIIALRSALNRQDEGLRMMLCAVTIVRKVSWNITSEQTAKGLAWLRTPRNYNCLTPQCQSILNAFSHFTFEGVEVVSNGYRDSFYPVYRVYAKSGSSFAYTSSPWQEAHWGGPGKNFEVLGMAEVQR